MSWNMKSLIGSGADVKSQLPDAMPQELSDRASGVVALVENFLTDLVAELESDGIHIAVSASGHMNDSPGNPGDSVSVSVSAIPAPNAPTSTETIPVSASNPAGDPTLVQPGVVPFSVPQPVEPTPTTPTGVVVPPDPVVGASTLATEHAATITPPAVDPPAQSGAETGTTISGDASNTVPPAGAASDTLSQQQGTVPTTPQPDSTQATAPAVTGTTGAVAPDVTPVEVAPTTPQPPTTTPGAPGPQPPAAPSPLDALIAQTPPTPQPAAEVEFPLVNSHPGSPRFGQRYKDVERDGETYHVYASGESVRLEETPAHEEPGGQAPVSSMGLDPSSPSSPMMPVDPTPPASSSRPLYTHDGPFTADGTWTAAAVKEPDGTPLYHYVLDNPGSPPVGDGLGGTWHLYTGPTVAA